MTAVSSDVDEAAGEASADGHASIHEDGSEWTATPDAAASTSSIWFRRLWMAAVAVAVGALVLGVATWAVGRTGPSMTVLPQPTQVPETPPDGAPSPDATAASTPTGSPPSASAGPSAAPGLTTHPTTPTAQTTAPTTAPTPTPTTLAIGAVRSLQWVGQTTSYVAQTNGLGVLIQVTASSGTPTKQAATFTVVAGLARADCYSFTSGGRYLRHFNYRLRLDINNSSALFRQDATFCARSGSVAGAVAFESVNYPGRYIHQRANELWLDPLENTTAFRTDSSFLTATAWA
jgi:hypothetical protein